MSKIKGMYTLFNAKRSNGDNTNEVQLDSAIDQAISYMWPKHILDFSKRIQLDTVITR